MSLLSRRRSRLQETSAPHHDPVPVSRFAVNDKRLLRLLSRLCHLFLCSIPMVFMRASRYPSYPRGVVPVGGRPPLPAWLEHGLKRLESRREKARLNRASMVCVRRGFAGVMRDCSFPYSSVVFGGIVEIALDVGVSPCARGNFRQIKEERLPTPRTDIPPFSQWTSLRFSRSTVIFLFFTWPGRRPVAGLSK